MFIGCVEFLAEEGGQFMTLYGKGCFVMWGALFQTDKWEMNELPGGYDLNSALKTQCWYLKNA